MKKAHNHPPLDACLREAASAKAGGKIEVGRWLREPLARRGVAMVCFPLTPTLSRQGRGD
ncbi:MAG: hypothetical protein QME90_09220 [Thermodesulfobacteriota bacterium]|nr:hypothetical protein [Thermodesulfobacteriota bacterium]